MPRTPAREGNRGAAQQPDAADEARLEPNGSTERGAHHPWVVRASQLIRVFGRLRDEGGKGRSGHTAVYGSRPARADRAHHWVSRRPGPVCLGRRLTESEVASFTDY